MPYVAGRELAGVVAKVSGEGKWQVGDRVSELIVGLGPWLMSAFGRLLLCLRIIGTCARQPFSSGWLRSLTRLCGSLDTSRSRAVWPLVLPLRLLLSRWACRSGWTFHLSLTVQICIRSFERLGSMKY